MAEGWGEAPIDEKNLEFSWPAPSGNTRSTTQYTQQRTQSSFQPPPPQQPSQNQFSQYQSPPPPPPPQQQLQPSPLQQPPPPPPPLQQQQLQPPPLQQQPPPPPPPLQQQQPPPPPPLQQQQQPPPPLQQQQQPPPPLQQQQQQQSFLPQRPTSIVSPPPQPLLTLQQQQPIIPPESFPPVQQTQQQQIPVPQTQQYYQSKSPILPSQPSLPIKTQNDDVFLKNSIEQTAPSYQNNLVANDHHRNLQKDHMSVYNDDAWDPSYDSVQTSSSTKPLQSSPFKVIDSQPTFASKDLQKDKSPAIQKGFNDATTQTDPDHIDLTIINLMQQKYSFTITLPNNKVIPPSKLSQFIDVFTESQKTFLPYSSSSSLPITKINNNVAAATTAPSYSSNINNDLLKDTSQSYLIKFDDNDYQKSPQVIQQPPQKSPQLTNNRYNDNEILDTARKDDLIAHSHQPVQHQKTPSSNFGNDNQRGWVDGNIPQQQQSNWGKGPVATPAVAPVVKSAETWNNGPQKSPLQQQQPNKYNDNGISDTSGKNRDLIAPSHPPVQHQQAPSSNFSSNSQRGWIDGNTPQPQQPIPQQLPPQTPPVATPAVAPVATGVESWENEVKEEDWLEKAAKFEQELNVDPKIRIGIDDGRTNSTTANNIPSAVTNSHSNGYGRGGANREYQGIGNGSGRPNAKALWDQLLRAETENDLSKFKRIFEEYTTAAPDETFQSIAKDLRSAKSNAKLMALDQSHTNNIASMTSKSLVDLQGHRDKKYLVYITFGPPNSVPPELGRIASSEPENYEWLANAGLPKDNMSNSNNNNTYNDNNVPLCYNCNQKGHISKNCPESSRGGDINNRPLQQYSSSTYENRNGAGGNDYHSKSYESRYSSGSGGNNMMGGGSNNSPRKCYKCGSSDHIARKCEEQQSRFGGGSGGGDRGDYQQRRGYNNNNGYGNNNSFGGSGSGGGYGGSGGGGYGANSGGGYGGSSGGGYGGSSGGGYGANSGGGRQPWSQNNDINNNMRGGEINASANGNEPNLDNVGAWWKNNNN